MNNFLYFYQHLPADLKPDISVFGFSVSWYSVMYIMAFAVVYLLVRYRIKLDEISNFEFRISKQYRMSEFPISKLNNSKLFRNSKLEIQNFLLDFLLYVFVGLIIGARLGEVFFYNFSYYMADPVRIISPFDPVTHKFIGIYGMSYHGGLIGVIIAALIWTRTNKINFWSWANFIVPAVPAGYFFGRMGNFINGELYGRMTSKPWGMYFDREKYLRHPSQLYEAALEGVILFAILWPMRNNNLFKKYGLAIYIFGYAAARYLAEFFRQPDGWIGPFTTGQFLSVIMFIGSFLLFLYIKKRAIIFKENKNTANGT